MSELQEKVNQIALDYLTALADEDIGSDAAIVANDELYKLAQAVEKLSNGMAKMTEAEAREKELEIRQQEADSKRLEANAKAEEVKIKQQEADIKAKQVANEKAKAEADQKLKAEEIGVKKFEVASRNKTEMKRYIWEGAKVAITCAASAGLTVFCTMASEKGWFTNKAGLAQVPKIRF